MKEFKNYNEFAVCTMQENLQAAKICLDTPKKSDSNSCYGMSAIILMSSVIDALGMFYRNGTTWTPISEQDVKNKKLGKATEHFGKFYDKFLSNSGYDRSFFVGEFYDYARCRATHNNVLGPKIKITINQSAKGIVFEKKHPSASTTVYLNELYNEVQNAYNLFLAESIITCDEIMQPTTGTTKNDSVSYVNN